MENNQIVILAIVVLVIALIGVCAYSFTGSGIADVTNVTNATNATSSNDTVTNDTNSTVDAIPANDTVRTNATGENTTARVYNPQSDSYVTVIGEGYDDEVDRWYTYDSDGVRYYNTRMN